ncbi:MAG: hypothetical protein C4B59_00870 [Candidatus Methanogaster sp.]|uniref:Uncharacterized protein n=1 Tax=Candidatus Methanogaster sp. TaxID=3386292 RepID=A0AC61L784_9EURY|nr:MAG: hypothetical protein C4B59_00870 [ANME-2 cluster archaeon]
MLMNWNNVMKQINANLIKVLSACLLLSLAVQCCAAIAVTVSIADVTADPGENVTVPLMVNGITDYGSGTINITYDPSAVHVIGVTSSPDSTVLAFNNNNVVGFTKISAMNTDGASGDIVFANVEFTAVGGSGGSIPLNLDVVTLYDRSYNDLTSGDVSTSHTPTPTTHSTSSSGGSTTGAVSITTPAPTPSPTPTPSAEDDANPASTSESTSHSDGGAGEETGAPGTTSPTTKPTPESQTSISGFEAIFAVIGLMISSLILRRDNT